MLAEWTTLPGSVEIVERITRTESLDEARRLLTAYQPADDDRLGQIFRYQIEGNLFYRQAFETGLDKTGKTHALIHASQYWEYAMLLCFEHGYETHLTARRLLINRIKAAEVMRWPIRPLAEAMARDMRFFEHASREEEAEYYAGLFWLAVGCYFRHDAERFYKEVQRLAGGDCKKEFDALLKLRGGQYD